MNKLTIYRGDTVTINATFTDVDLTGATVYFTAKPAVDDNATDATAPIKKDVTSHTDPTNGVTQINLTATDTNSADPGKYGYDIQLKTAAGSISTVEVGQLIVKGDYTRRTT